MTEHLQKIELFATRMLSILFAIFAIRLVHNQGSFSEDEIRNKQGNLL